MNYLGTFYKIPKIQFQKIRNTVSWKFYLLNWRHFIFSYLISAYNVFILSSPYRNISVFFSPSSKINLFIVYVASFRYVFCQVLIIMRLVYSIIVYLPISYRGSGYQLASILFNLFAFSEACKSQNTYRYLSRTKIYTSVYFEWVPESRVDVLDS